MAAIADIVIADGQGSPVNHTFTATLQEGINSSWFDRVSGVVAGYPSIKIQTNLDKADADVDKYTISLAVPELEALSASASGFTPGPTVAYVERFKGEFIIAKRATQAQRDNLAAYAKNLMAHAVVTNMVKNRDVPY
jgi:hypothetical protein